MVLFEIICIVIFVCMLYLIFLHSFVKSIYFGLRKEKFDCTRCGECCKLLVRLDDEDVVRLEAAGKKDFYEQRNGRKYLKRAFDGYCIFYNRDNGRVSYPGRFSLFNEKGAGKDAGIRGI